MLALTVDEALSRRKEILAMIAKVRTRVPCEESDDAIMDGLVSGRYAAIEHEDVFIICEGWDDPEGKGITLIYGCNTPLRSIAFADALVPYCRKAGIRFIEVKGRPEWEAVNKRYHAGFRRVGDAMIREVV